MRLASPLSPARGAAILLTALLLGPASGLGAQQWGASAGVVGLTWRGYALRGNCTATTGFSPGVSVSAGRALAVGALWGRLRYHPAIQGVEQLCSVLFVPSEPGTFVYLTDENSLEDGLVAADMAFQLAPRTGWISPVAALGMGMFSQGAGLVPILLGSGGVALGPRRARLVLTAEYQRLALPFDRVQETWIADPARGYPMRVSQSLLGQTRLWKPALMFGLRIEVAPDR